MDTIPYTKRELDEKFNDLQISLDRIEAQTRKTNGSVATAFIEINSLKNWRWFLAGMGCFIVVFIIPIIIAFVQSGKI